MAASWEIGTLSPGKKETDRLQRRESQLALLGRITRFDEMSGQGVQAGL